MIAAILMLVICDPDGLAFMPRSPSRAHVDVSVETLARRRADVSSATSCRSETERPREAARGDHQMAPVLPGLREVPEGVVEHPPTGLATAPYEWAIGPARAGVEPHKHVRDPARIVLEHIELLVDRERAR